MFCKPDYLYIIFQNLHNRSKSMSQEMHIFGRKPLRRTDNLSWMLIFICLVFVCCQVTIIISCGFNTANVALDYNNKVIQNIHDYFVVIANTFLSFGSATNFIIYVVCGTHFKRTLKSMFLKCLE